MIIALAAAALAAAQTFTTFTGTFVDPQGAVLPGVRATISDTGHQTRHEVVSGRDGRVVFAGLTPGTYEFGTELAGFAPYHASLTLTTQPRAQVITLQIGRLQETITILEGTATPAARRAQAPPRPDPPCSAPPMSAGGRPVGGNLRPPNKIRDVKPDYPAGLRGTGADAVVVLDAVVGIDGFLKDVRARDTADQLFVSALIAAVRDWQFDSTLLNCAPVEVAMTISATFKHRP